jgi:hypothetical protein
MKTILLHLSIILILIIPKFAIASPVNEYTFIREFGRAGTASNQFMKMDGIAVDRFGQVFVSDVFHLDPGYTGEFQVVKRWTVGGMFEFLWGNHNNLEGRARGIDCSCDGDPFYIAPSQEGTESNIEHTDPYGAFRDKFPPNTKMHFRDVAVSADGRVYAILGEGAESKRIMRYEWNGTNWITGLNVNVLAEGGLSDHAWGIDADAWRDRVYVTVISDTNGSAGIKVYDLNLILVNNLPLPASAGRPYGIAVDNRDGSFLVCEADEDMIHKFSPDGIPLRSFGSTGTGQYEFNDPSDVDVDMNGWLFVADSGNDRVQVYAPPREGNLNFIVYKSKLKVGWKQKLKGKQRDMLLVKALAAIDVYTNITSMVGMPFSFWCSEFPAIQEMTPTKTNKKGTKGLYKPDKEHKAIVQYRPDGALLRIKVKVKRVDIATPLNITDTTPLPPWLWLTAQMTLSNEYLGVHYMRMEHRNKTGKVYKAWKK